MTEGREAGSTAWEDTPRARPPHPDWDELGAPPPPGSGRRPATPDLRPLFGLLDFLRSLLPRELHAQFNTLTREILLTLRALIDWYLDRLDGRSREPEVEEIPID